MAERECEGPTKCGWVESERVLAKTFDAWRAEFREILEEHRKDIQNRLEKIERQIEQKSDKDYVALMVSGINDELARHADEIKGIHTALESKAGTDSLWKLAAIIVAVGGVLSGIISMALNYIKR
jgi:predicted phage gp36 major capsid-like protein